VDESAVPTAWSSRTAQDTALLLYTSGTTADPKGCELTHEALIRSWSAYNDLVGFEPDQSMWTPCPFFHVGGIGVTVSALVRGATMMSMNWFEPKTALAHIEQRRAEHLFPAFPPLTLGLLRAPGYDPSRLTFVKTILNVAPADTQRVIETLLPEETVLLTDFGMTEGAGMITVTPRDAAGEDRLTRNGTPLPGIEVRVTNPEDPKTIQPNDLPGEIQFRGINAFRAYYKNPAETAATIIDDGWVRTGDLGTLDSRGQLLFLGRIKDVLKVGGENVGCAEVEVYLLSHPDVVVAAVVGIPDPTYDEVPAAFLQLRPGAALSGDGVVAFCRTGLAKYKVPRFVRFVTDWPMSATKIQKFRLRDRLLAELPDRRDHDEPVRLGGGPRED
jgi:acyl-CoA synthetase (AMP-forming)/AMP-acid ligase II